VTPPGSHRRTQDSVWRDRDLFIVGHDAIVAFLRGIWNGNWTTCSASPRWGFNDDRIAVRFQYEWHDRAGHWFRCYSNELSEFSSDGLMQRREASVRIAASDRRYFAPRREDMKGVGIPLQ
jgi:nuclear transport factor 2 (NTF2) superfamily protein